MTPAEAYVELALWGIKLSQGPSSLRDWWAAERPKREQYGLSQEQINLLIEACKEQVAIMEERATDIEPSKPKQRPRAPRRRAAI